MKDNQQILGTEPIGKLLIKYSVPAIISMMVNGLLLIYILLFNFLFINCIYNYYIMNNLGLQYLI